MSEYFSSLHLPVVASDPIFGLQEQFQKDIRKEKIDLTVGVYKDEYLQTPPEFDT